MWNKKPFISEYPSHLQDASVLISRAKVRLRLCSPRVSTAPDIPGGGGGLIFCPRLLLRIVLLRPLVVPLDTVVSKVLGDPLFKPLLRPLQITGVGL